MQSPSARHSLSRFFRLWLVLTVSFVMIKLLLEIGLLGVIDLRLVALWQLPIVPLGQTVLYWLLTRGAGDRPLRA